MFLPRYNVAKILWFTVHSVFFFLFPLLSCLQEIKSTIKHISQRRKHCSDWRVIHTAMWENPGNPGNPVHDETREKNSYISQIKPAADEVLPPPLTRRHGTDCCHLPQAAGLRAAVQHAPRRAAQLRQIFIIIALVSKSGRRELLRVIISWTRTCRLKAKGRWK